MDGELADSSARAGDTDWGALARDPAAREAWLEYHQVGDWLRSADLHGGFDERAFLRRFGERLRAQPVQFAPEAAREVSCTGWRPGLRATPWAQALGAALAGLAMLVLVGGLLPQRPDPWGAPRQLAALPRGVLALGTPAARAAAAAMRRVSFAPSASDARARRATFTHGNVAPPWHGRPAARLRDLRGLR